MVKTLLLATALLVSATVGAHARESVGFADGFDCKEPLHWADRIDDRDARLAITTRDGKVTLLLTDRVMAMQLSNHTMHRVDRELHEKRHEHDTDDNAFADAIRGAVIGAVRSLLDHSAECAVRDVRDVRYEDGRLEILARDGTRLYEKVDVDDRDALDDFDANDARLFVREFHRMTDRAR